MHCQQTLCLAPLGFKICISNIKEAMDSDPDETVRDFRTELYELLNDLKGTKI
jgi:hypothetical protein